MAPPTPAGRSSVAAGAARASGERARRRSTPLLPDPIEPTPGNTGPATPPSESAKAPAPAKTTRAKSATRAKAAARAKATAPAKAAAPAAAATLDTHPSRKATAPATGSAAPHLRVVPDDAGDAAYPPASSTERLRPDLAELLEGAVSVARTAAIGLGLPTDEAEARVAQVLAFLRRRLTGDYTVDDFGFDPDFAEHVTYPLLRPLFTKWFRVEVRGIEHIPSTGGALIVANHSGTVALDSLMTQLAVHDFHPEQRTLRELGADLVFSTPVLGNLARKGGATLATNPDAERLLRSGELVGVWPEGFKGVGKPFSERYKLQRFGRGGFVSAALRTSTPIIPCAIVGAEEIYPMLGDLKSIARVLGLPYLPVTPFFPLLGPLGLIPLPSKWIIEFGAPVDTATLGPAAADDPMLVFDLTDRVRETIQQTLYSLLMQRRSVFF